MAWYNIFKKEESKPEIVEGYQSFSTPFGKVGGANLALPYVNGRYQISGYIPFGHDNLYPQLLTQLYFTSPLHGAIVDFKTNAATGGGYVLKTDKLTNEEKLNVYTFEKKAKLNKLVPSVTKQLIVHNRVYFKLFFNDKGEVKKIENVFPDKVRVNKEKSCYYICEDWASRIDVEPIKPYSPSCGDKVQLYVYEYHSLGQDYYSLPTYSSCTNWIFLDGEMSYLHKSNIQNSIFPSFAMMFPKKPQSEEEKHIIKDTIDKMKGAANAGKAVAFFANSAENLPKIETISTNNNDQLFIQTDGRIDEKICQAHTIDPILMGIRVSGKLGSGSDIKQSYVIFEKNSIMPLRNEVEEIFNDILFIARLNVEFELNNYQIIGDIIEEETKIKE